MSEILTSLEGLTGVGVGAVVVTANPENARELAEMLTEAGVGCTHNEGGEYVRINPECDVDHIIAVGTLSSTQRGALRLVAGIGWDVIDLGDNDLCN